MGNNTGKDLIEYAIDHFKHFECYPMEFEFEDGKVIYSDEIMKILTAYEKENRSNRQWNH